MQENHPVRNYEGGGTSVKVIKASINYDNEHNFINSPDFNEKLRDKSSEPLTVSQPLTQKIVDRET